MEVEEDLKKYLKISEKKVEKSLNKCKGLMSINKVEEKDWMEYFKFNSKISSLENFCRYRAAGAFGLYEDGYDDADITTPVIEHFKEKLKNIAEVSDVKVGKEISDDEKYRTFQVFLKDQSTPLYFETDTAISLMGDFGNFMRNILKKKQKQEKQKQEKQEKTWVQTYMDAYNLPSNWGNYAYNPFRIYYWGKIQSEIENMFTEEIEHECYESFEERAKHTHTIQNMMLVPYGYNSARGFWLKIYKSDKKINDRLDLTMCDFVEMCRDKFMCDKTLQVRLRLKRNKEFATLSAVKFLMKYQNELMPSIPKFNSECERNTIEGLLKKNEIINACYKK